MTYGASGSQAGEAGIPSNLIDGDKDVATAGTRVTLVAAATESRHVFITAKAANTGKIWVGGATIAADRGVYLNAGDTIDFPIADLQKVQLDAAINGEGVTFTALT